MHVQPLHIRRPSPHVAEVWLNRPEVRNAIDRSLIDALAHAIAELGADADVRVIVLAGHGKAFCAGADLAWMREAATWGAERNRAEAQALADMLWALDSCPVPLVGRIHGDCYAGGVGLAAVCDVVAAVEGANFCLSEARLGLLPATIGPYVLRAMGEQAARRYMVTAERFSAAQAHAMGLVHELCAADVLDAAVAAVVAAIVANGPRATQACKQLVKDLAHQPITPAWREGTARRMAEIRASAEGREGVQSFLDKRKPSWVGPT